MAKLDTREARRLTSREISKCLGAAVGGLLDVAPERKENLRIALDGLAKLTRGSAFRIAPISEAIPVLDAITANTGDWSAPIVGLIGGFHGWCDPLDIATAIEWLVEHLDGLAEAIAKR